MDADLQHDETILPDMLGLLMLNAADLVVGSRYTKDGDAGGLEGSRAPISRIATECARLLTRTRVSDPLSGFFMVKRDLIERYAHDLECEGFKILLDILVTARNDHLRVTEIPYRFRPRAHGESKFDLRSATDFGALLMAKLTHSILPLRFFSFLLVGASGVIVQLFCLREGLRTGLPFPIAETLATLLAMTSNFLLNNLLTYRDQRIAGWRLVPSLLTFYGVCSIGALSNIGVSYWIFAQWPVWWIAGIAGSVVGAVWNFSCSSVLVWKNA